MTLYEQLTLSISILAIVVSIVSLVRTRKVEAEQLKLQRPTAELSKLQIAGIEEQERLKTKPQLDVEIKKAAGSSNFVISNNGQGSAYKVDLEFIDCDCNPLVSVSKDKLPYPEIRPNSSIKLLDGDANDDGALSYQVKLMWQESSGELHTETRLVSR